MILDIWKGNMLEYMTVANAILHVLKDLYSLNIPLLFLFFFSSMKHQAPILLRGSFWLKALLK